MRDNTTGPEESQATAGSPERDVMEGVDSVALEAEHVGASSTRSAAQVHTLAPDPVASALAHVVRSIDDALLALAMWCPHGMDSSRVGDYHTADEARDLLERAKAILGSRSA